MTEHTPGPWGWFGTNHGFYLATTHSGRRFVMDFVRMGMRSAQPRFQVNSRMVNGADLVQFEVDRSVTGFAAGREAATVYRYDIVDIDHPDARLIAAAPDLLAALEFYIGGEPGPEYVEYRSPAAVRKVVRAAIAKARQSP